MEKIHDDRATSGTRSDIDAFYTRFYSRFWEQQSVRCQDDRIVEQKENTRVKFYRVCEWKKKQEL